MAQIWRYFWKDICFLYLTYMLYKKCPQTLNAGLVFNLFKSFPRNSVIHQSVEIRVFFDCQSHCTILSLYISIIQGLSDPFFDSRLLFCNLPLNFEFIALSMFDLGPINSCAQVKLQFGCQKIKNGELFEKIGLEFKIGSGRS